MSSTIDDFIMTESDVSKGIKLCFTKVKRLLDDAQLLIDHNKGNESAHALGLYTFAVEEYGKALLLKECLAKKQPDGKIRVPMWIFAKRKVKSRSKKESNSHWQKILKAYNTLPKESVHCTMGIVNEPNGKLKRVKTSHGTMVIPKSASGYVSYSGPVDFETRMQCFYVDWDEEQGEWKYEMTSSNTDLSKVIKAFQGYLTKQNPS